jgi:hypothetical protein
MPMLAVLASACAGCQPFLTPPPPSPACAAQPPASAQQTIRVKAPPQKIVIEQAECAPEVEAPQGQPESAPAKPPPKEGRPESARKPQREAAEQPEAAPEAGGAAVALGALGALGQLSGFSRTTAMTRPLGTVNPGCSALGIGITWIHIPIPIPRLFSVEETPSLTVPLSEANLIPADYTGIAGGATSVAGGRGVTRQELAALLAQELAAQRAQQSRREAAAAGPPADDAERRRLEKKLSDAEEQIDRLSKALKAIDDKLPAPKMRPAP